MPKLKSLALVMLMSMLACPGLARSQDGHRTFLLVVDDLHLRRARIAVATARDAIRVVASRAAGPVVVLYFSNGYAEPSVASDLAELASDAYRVNATLYAFDFRLIRDPLSPPGAGKELEWENDDREARESLSSLAESTGGRLISTAGSFDAALAEIAQRANR
jgi:hypothetical protein